MLTSMLEKPAYIVFKQQNNVRVLSVFRSVLKIRVCLMKNRSRLKLFLPRLLNLTSFLAPKPDGAAYFTDRQKSHDLFTIHQLI
jgi:hypothetical protein